MCNIQDLMHKSGLFKKNKKNNQEKSQRMIPRHRRYYYSEGREGGRQYEFNHLLRDSSVGMVNSGKSPLISHSGFRKVTQNTTEISSPHMK